MQPAGTAIWCNMQKKLHVYTTRYSEKMAPHYREHVKKIAYVSIWAIILLTNRNHSRLNFSSLDFHLIKLIFWDYGGIPEIELISDVNID